MEHGVIGKRLKLYGINQPWLGVSGRCTLQWNGWLKLVDVSYANRQNKAPELEGDIWVNLDAVAIVEIEVDGAKEERT